MQFFYVTLNNRSRYCHMTTHGTTAHLICFRNPIIPINQYVQTIPTDPSSPDDRFPCISFIDQEYSVTYLTSKSKRPCRADAGSGKASVLNTAMLTRLPSRAISPSSE